MSRKSSKPEAFGNPGSIANAMYDAQKKEITSSIAFGFSFIGAGLITAIIGILKYFDITSKISDSSENYDAGAWLVIGGVGILVAVIGFISIMKSFVSLGQIGSWAKEAESHASPFQGQKLNRKVAAMNQAQSMNKPDMQGMAEDGGTQKRRGFFKRGKETKRKNNDDLYYKYNPQEKKLSAPPKAAPMMEQKFDYGINEEKKLTFADEFLKKNKRDPFAQYRKELGIAEEPEKQIEKKPQFIKSASAVTPDHNLSESQTVFKPLNTENQSDNTTEPILELSSSEPSQNSKEVGFDLSLSYFAEESTKAEAPSVKIEKTEITESKAEDISPVEASVSSELIFEEEATFMTSNTASKSVEEEIISADEIETVREQPELTGIEITYGDHNDSDDDIFFSLRNLSAPVTQQPVQIQTQTQRQALKPRDEKPVASAPQNVKPAAVPNPTISLDLGYRKSTNTEYEKPEEQKKTSTVTSSDDVSPKNKPIPSPTVSLDLDYNKNTKTEYDFSLFEEIDPKTKDTKKPAESDSFPNKATKRNNEQDSSSVLDLSDDVNKSASLPYNLDLFAEKENIKPDVQQITKSTAEQTASDKSEKTENKKSFSEMYLNKDKNKKQDEESKIVKNGTRAQRKFVDASEYDEWTCSKCGKVNQEYTGVCACGTRKPRAKKK